MVLIAALIHSCSQEEPVEYSDSDTDSETARSGPSQLKRRTFGYPVTLTDAASAGALALDATATTFTMTLSGCASTLATSVTETKAYLELYEFDRNCLVKLTVFTLNGKTYTPKVGSTFTTWQTGDLAVFEKNGASPADELNVKIISTISNPVTAAGTIQYRFSEITEGDTENVAESVVRKSASIAVNGQAAPNFEINRVQLADITANGNGEFRFQMECKDFDVTGTGNNILCEDVLLSSITMALAVDNYVSALTETDLQNIFTAAGGGKSIDMLSEAFVAGDGTPVLTHGGFITANTGDTDVMVLSGVKPIVSYPNMVFVLKSGPSYTYFRIVVSAIDQTNAGP